MNIFQNKGNEKKEKEKRNRKRKENNKYETIQGYIEIDEHEPERIPLAMHSIHLNRHPKLESHHCQLLLLSFICIIKNTNRPAQLAKVRGPGEITTRNERYIVVAAAYHPRAA